MDAAASCGSTFPRVVWGMFQTFWPIFVTIFLVVDPIGLVPLYISVSARLEPRDKDRTIIRAVLTALIILVLFIIAGRSLLSLLGVSPGAFFIAGGVMLFLVALEMLFGKPKSSKTSQDEQAAPDGSEDGASVAIFPLAIPMLAGPGAITTIIIFTSQGANPLAMGSMLVGAVALTLLTAALAMKLSGVVLRAIGRTGVSVIERIMGLLLSGMAVQFVYDGLVKLGVFATR